MLKIGTYLKQITLQRPAPVVKPIPEDKILKPKNAITILSNIPSAATIRSNPEKEREIKSKIILRRQFKEQYGAPARYYYKRSMKRLDYAEGDRPVPYDPDLVSRKMVLANQAEIPLDKLRLRDRLRNEYTIDNLKYGQQQVTRLDWRPNSPVEVLLSQWVYTNFKLHERWKNLPEADRVRTSCQIEQRGHNVNLPVDPMKPTRANLMKTSEKEIKKIFYDYDPDSIPDNRQGYSYCLSYKKAVNLVRKMCTNRLKDTHIFLIQPNISQVTNAVLNQNPASLTLLEPAECFKDHLETITTLYNQDNKDFKKPVYFSDEPLEIAFNEKLKFEKIFQEPEIEKIAKVKGIWNEKWSEQSPPMAHIILPNCGGSAFKPLFS